MKVWSIERIETRAPDGKWRVDYEVFIETTGGRFKTQFMGMESPPNYSLIWQRFNDHRQIWKIWEKAE